MAKNEEFNNKLLVEGKDDQHVVWALCEKFNINQNFDVIVCLGIDKLLAQIPVRLKQSGAKSIGIIFDADTNFEKRYNSLKSIFETSEMQLPEDFPSNGLIKRFESIKIGVWIMPNNNLNGMLEDFIAYLIPNDDKLFSLIKSNIDHYESLALNKYKPIHKSKAELHSWLAVQETPGTPIGQSITKKYLSTDLDLCRDFVNWLVRLFED